jgi:hypothetical protein
MKLSNIKFAHLGNGITVYSIDIVDSDINDFAHLAHISKDRVVKFNNKHIDKLTTRARNHILDFAKYANPKISATQDDNVFTTKVKDTYIITGKDVYGKRFKITTTTPQHYNIYHGTLWKYVNGTRKFIKYY